MNLGNLRRNKKIFLNYNNFRKTIFSELAPKESEAVLYLIPWMLSVNHPECPGYIPNLKKKFRVFGIDNEIEIRKREPHFKRRFNIKVRDTLLKPPDNYLIIQGLYTIGSVGSISQTSVSDCDIWVCYDKLEFNETSWIQLNQKLNLIKDWLDINIKMPIFFFITDVNDIRQSNFGSVDTESSGSVQRNILKEEFYRTCIVICGKVPLWWICLEEKKNNEYDKIVENLAHDGHGEYDIIDFGDIKSIDQNEYFGAALWQLHKSLTHPLKTIVKMIQLKMHLDAPDERLLCEQFREQILYGRNQDLFPDPSVFTMISIFKYYEKNKKGVLQFLKECFYLRCEIKPYERKQTIKKQLATNLFKEYSIDIRTRTALSNFNSWKFDSQIDLGNKVFKLMLQIYREFLKINTEALNKANEQDLTILGRRIVACYQTKNFKVPVVQKPLGKLNLSTLSLSLENDSWHVYSGTDKSKPLVSSRDIIYCIAFMVWNNLFFSTTVHMEPNASAVTLQEVINLGKKMSEFLGSFDAAHMELSNYLEKDFIVKLLIIVSFEKSPWEKDINDFAVVYKNSWGELFVRRFDSPRKLENFVLQSVGKKWNVETSYYVQRNCTYYEKMIERTKKILVPLKNIYK